MNARGDPPGRGGHVTPPAVSYGSMPAMPPNPFLERTAADMLDAVAARWPDGEAVVAADLRLSFAEVRDGARRLARAFLALGIAKGDKVAVWLPNRPSWLLAQHACAMIGAVTVALNPQPLPPKGPSGGTPQPS